MAASARSRASLPLPAVADGARQQRSGEAQAKGVRQLLGQGECFVAPLQGLVRIAKKPQTQAATDPARHPRVQPVDEGQRAVLLGIIEGNALL